MKEKSEDFEREGKGEDIINRLQHASLRMKRDLYVEKSLRSTSVWIENILKYKNFIYLYL